MKTELSKNKLSIKKCPICNCKLPVHKMSCPAVSIVVFLPPCSGHELESQKDEENMKNLKNLKVVKIDSDSLTFSNGMVLTSEHDSDCCESHYLDLSDLTLNDFKGLEFDLSNDNFFKRIKDYGIELKPITGYSVKIPGYGFNNGYYSENLDLIITKINGKGIFKNII